MSADSSRFSSASNISWTRAVARFLLLEPVAQALHLRAEFFVLLAQLRTAAEQLDDPPVLSSGAADVVAAE